MVGHPDLRPDNAEVTEGKWWTQEEILHACKAHRLLTPNFESEFLRVRSALQSLL